MLRIKKECKKYKNVIDVWLIVIIAVCMVCPFLSLEKAAASEEVLSAAASEGSVFSSFLAQYRQIKPGTYASSGHDYGGWCEEEGVLAAFVQDFNDDGQDECLMIYISKADKEKTDSNLHALHLAVLSSYNSTCKVTFDLNLGVFDHVRNCEHYFYLKEYSGKKYIVYEQFESLDSVYQKILVFHVDESGKLFTDKYIYNPGGVSTTLFSQKKPDYYVELPVGNIDDFSCIYFSEGTGQDSEEYGECLNSEIKEFGLEVSLQEVSYGQTIWKCSEDTLSEICGMIAYADQNDNNICEYSIWNQQNHSSDSGETPVTEHELEQIDSAPKYYDVEQERLHIVDIYNEINNSISSYQMRYGYPDYLVRYNSFLMNLSEDICWLNSRGAVRKQLCHSDNLSIEGYHEEPETVGKSLDHIIQLEDTLVFIFSYTSDGREYRIYFKGRDVIRYIGPDSVKHDYSEGLNFSEFYQLWSGTEDGEAIWKSVGSIAPGWWTGFEMPDE